MSIMTAPAARAGRAPVVRVQARGLPAAWVIPGAAALVLLATGLVHSLAIGLNAADEAYFLHVAGRVAAGEVIFRDVEFPATPLSVYALAALLGSVGGGVLVLKLAGALMHATTGVVWLRVDRQLGGAAMPALPLVAVLVLSHPSPEALYTPLAMLLLAVAVSAALDAPEQPDGAVLAGVAAGLAFAAKQNVGALAAAVVAGLLWSQRARARQAWTAAGAFAAASLVPLLPVVTAGGAGALLDYGFASKAEYVRAAQISWVETVHDVLHGVRHADSLAALGVTAWDVAALLPLSAIGLVALASVRSRGAVERHRLLAAALILGAALAAAYPRMDAPHLVHAAPGAAVAAAFALRALTTSGVPFGRAARPLLAAASVAAVALALAAVSLRLSSADLVPSTLPALRGVRVPLEVARDLERLRAASGQAPPRWFHLSPRAGLYYLATGAPNRTPFAYPVVSDIGSGGEALLADRVRAGEVSGICVDEPRLAGLRPQAIRPVALEHWVETHLQRGPDLGPCRLYVRPEERLAP
jgi:hypothetical protein